MDDAAFWQLIEESRENAGGDPNEQAAELTDLLSALPAGEIVQFDRRFRELLVQAYRWDLWGAAFLIDGGCSDDGFEYFRCWLISQGRRVYEEALADPESLAERAEPDVEAESMLYAAADAYEVETGKPLPSSSVGDPAEPAGQPWEENDLPRRFPRLAAAFP
ncbi:MAG: DUF4240 domain-containing protein [Chloroflexi bacterium]|nr:DUF4240 domain-containing protein [Chloroflexota bacterium]